MKLDKINISLIVLILALSTLGGVYAHASKDIKPREEIETQLTVLLDNVRPIYGDDLELNLTYTPGMRVSIPYQITEKVSGKPVPQIYTQLYVDTLDTYSEEVDNCRVDDNGYGEVSFTPNTKGQYLLVLHTIRSWDGKFVNCEKDIWLNLK